MEINQARNDAIRALTQMLDLSLPGEGGHADRVAVLSVATGEKLGMDDEALVHLRRGATLHDIGKIGLSRHILQKMGELTVQEMDQVRVHAMLAEKIVESLPWLQPSMDMIRHHHERWDGLGYPDGLKGTDIPLGARIIAVAETYDVLTSPSSWKNWIEDGEAAHEIERCKGTQFDPTVVEAFLAIHDRIQPIFAAH